MNGRSRVLYDISHCQPIVHILKNKQTDEKLFKMFHQVEALRILNIVNFQLYKKLVNLE